MPAALVPGRNGLGLEKWHAAPLGMSPPPHCRRLLNLLGSAFHELALCGVLKA